MKEGYSAPVDHRKLSITPGSTSVTETEFDINDLKKVVAQACNRCSFASSEPQISTINCPKPFQADQLIQHIIASTNLNEFLINSLQYQLNQHIYNYGSQFRTEMEHIYPLETVESVVSRNLSVFWNAARSLKNIPNWVELAHSTHVGKEILVTNAYFKFSEQLKTAGRHAVIPVWEETPHAENDVEHVLRAACGVLRQLFSIDFSIFLDKRFLEALSCLCELLEAYYSHPCVKALLVPYTAPFFESYTTRLFQKYGKKTFLMIHGAPVLLKSWDGLELELDYYVVWGEHLRDQLVASGLPPSRVLVSGHPNYIGYKIPSEIRNDLSNPLVLTHGMTFCPSLAEYVYQNRGVLVDYAYRVQMLLKKLGVTHAKLRPHPSESKEWYERFVDKTFWTVDTSPLPEALNAASICLGPISTVALEATIHGVNYLTFIPWEYDPYTLVYQKTAPFDGSDPRYPVARTNAEFLEMLRNKTCLNPEYLTGMINPNFSLSEVLRIIDSKEPSPTNKRKLEHV